MYNCKTLLLDNHETFWRIKFQIPNPRKRKKYIGQELQMLITTTTTTTTKPIAMIPNAATITTTTA